jgi:hypothetical protein
MMIVICRLMSLMKWTGGRELGKLAEWKLTRHSSVEFVSLRRDVSGGRKKRKS